MSNIEFSLRLNKVKIDEFNFKEPDDSFINDFNEEFLKIGLGLKITHNIDDEIIGIHLNIIYDYINEDDHKIKLIEFKGLFEYKINDLKNIISDNSNGGINIPNVILETIIGLSISSSRGIIIAKTAGSFLNKLYLPLFNPSDIVKNLLKNENLEDN